MPIEDKPGPVAGADFHRELEEVKADIKAIKRMLDERSAACGDNRRKVGEAFETLLKAISNGRANGDGPEGNEGP